MIKDIETYAFSHDDRLLLDANIWLFTNGPMTYRYQNNADIYTKAVDKMSINECEVYIIPTIISEFINRCIVEELRHMGIPKVDRKAARNLPLFKPIAEKIANYVMDILSFAKCCDSPFDSLRVAAYMEEFKNCNADYNDITIADACKERELILVTDDYDFKNYPITVLTTNQDLLL
ncbi:MAG: hypothetical protein QG670_2887 [Thermoproteota archaeon]|nr:hypothetical protein [Thermoproteota archaeon]